MKPHYFDQEKPDIDDIQLKMAIHQGYVSKSCLLGGMVVFDEVNNGKNPCEGCNGPRDKCHGKAKAENAFRL